MPSATLTHFDSIPGAEPLTYPESKIGADSKAIAIYRDFVRFRDRKRAASIAHEDAQAALRADKAPLQRELREETDGRNPKINEKRVASLEARLADIDKQLTTNEEKFKSDPLNNIVGLSQIDEQLRVHSRSLKDRGTTDTAIDGKTAEQMHEYWADEVTRLGYEIEGIWLQPVSRAEIEARIVKDVNDIDTGNVNTEAVKYVRPRGLRNRPQQGTTKFPLMSSVSGDVHDVAAVLISVPAIKKMVVDHLVQQALAGHKDSSSFTPLQREQAIAAAKAEQREALYKVGVWYRRLLDEGRYVPARTTDALALLDVE